MSAGDLVFATSDPAQTNTRKGSLALGDLAIARQPFAFAAWINPSTILTSGPSRVALIANKYKTAGAFALYLYFDPLGQFWVGEPKGVALSLPQGITRMSLNSTRYDLGASDFYGKSPLNRWTHIAFTRDGSGTYKLYINGAMQVAAALGSTELTETPYWLGGQIDVGQTYDHDQEFVGSMRDVVWDVGRVWTDGNVKLIYESPFGATPLTYEEALNKVNTLETRLRLLESIVLN